MNVIVSSTPKHLVITPTMVDDFMVNPVLGAEIIFKLDLDEFQKARLRYSWFCPRVMDSSGFSSAKTFNAWVVSNLRCILMSDRWIGVYYQTFSTMQKTFWLYYNATAARSPLYRAQLGRIDMDDKDGKAATKGPSCWTVAFKNTSRIDHPAPGFLQDAKTQAGMRFNDLVVDEFTKIEASGSTGIDDQLVGRCTRETFNQHHPIHCNHQLFLATAEDTMHPAYDRYKTFMKEIRRGNPDYAVLSYSFKDYSNRKKSNGKTFKEAHREEKVMRDMKLNLGRAHYLQEGLGIWSQNGKGWYSSDLIERAFVIGKERGTLPMVGAHEDPHRKDPERKRRIFYFLGIDPAKADNKKSDDGALVALRAESYTDTPRDVRDWMLDPIWAYKVRRADGPTWASIIHRKHQQFGFSGMVLDYNGGGQWIRPELAKQKQKIRDEEVKVTPIACVEDEATMITGEFILGMFKRGDYKINKIWGDMVLKGDDNLVDKAHSELLEALQVGAFGFPPSPKEMDRLGISRVGWSEERDWASKLIHLTTNQMMAVAVQTNDDGTTYYSKNGARLFSAKGKKDFSYALLYAYVAFLAWLRTHEDDDLSVLERDQALCS